MDGMKAVSALSRPTGSEIASPAVAVKVHGYKSPQSRLPWTLAPLPSAPPSSPAGTTNAPGACASVSTYGPPALPASALVTRTVYVPVVGAVKLTSAHRFLN